MWAATAMAAPKPNLAFVLADDWGWGDAGAYAKLVNGGDKPPVTPHLDRMASEGTMFTRFHTLASVCSPSRTSWLTGSWPLASRLAYIWQCDHDANAAIGQSDYLNLSVPFLPRLLRQNGYRAAHYGKWHLGCTPDAPGVNDYGFDDSATYVSNGKTSEQIGDFGDAWFPANSSRMIVDRGIAFVNASLKARQPFYLNLWLHISHAPLHPTADQLINFNARILPVLRNAAGQDPRRRWVELVPDRHLPRVAARSGRADRPLPPPPPPARPRIVDLGALQRRQWTRRPARLPPFRRLGGRLPRAEALAVRGRRVDAADRVVAGPRPRRPRLRRRRCVDRLVRDAAALAGVALPPTVAAWARRRRVAVLLGQATTAKKRTHPLVWDYRFSMPGKCYHQSPMMSIVHSDVPNHPHVQWKLLMSPNRTRVELYNLTADVAEFVTVDAPDVVAFLAPLLEEWEASMPVHTPPDKVRLNPGCVANGGGALVVEVAPEGGTARERRRLYELA